MKFLINKTGVTNIPVGVLDGPYLQLDLGNQKGLSETITAGTLTFRAKAPGAYAYSAIVGDNSIDCSAPEPLVVGPNAIEFLECTAAGVDATGDLIELQLASFA